MNNAVNHQEFINYKALFESSPGLFLVLSPYLEIVAVSDAYLHATKTKREDIVGRGIFEVFPDNPDDPHATGVGNLHASLKRVLQKKVPDAMAVQKYDIPLPASEGGGFEERYWSPFNSPVFGEDNKLAYIIHQAEDVTDFVRLKQKGMEQDKLTEDLKIKAGQMETEIYLRAQQLQTANEQLRQSERLKDQFLSNMSHEIRTPMNAVIGFADLLDTTNLNKRQKEFNNGIKEAGQNLLHIINDILDFSKIEAGAIQIERVPFSLRSLADSIFRLLVNKADSKGIELIVNCDPDIHEVLNGDPTRITQILINLLSNAIKFTDRGFVKLDIVLKDRKENYRIIEFRVKDSGIGIPVEKQQEIFNRFTQASAETTRKFGGTGLGLSIVKSLVELQGGKIEVESVPGEGAEFRVAIPFETASYEQLSEYKTSHFNGHYNELKGIKVLLAEDNKMNQLVATEVLSGFGIITDVADNGKKAVDKIQEAHYDLILMDMQMAEMDGYQATIYIRRILKNNIPIIAMTAHAMTGEKEKCMALGMNDYISKPFKTAELYRKIRTLVLPGHGIFGNGISQLQSRVPRVVNLDYLKSVNGVDSHFVTEAINLFLSEAPELLQAMEYAVEIKDYDSLRLAAHKIHTSSGMMGISEMTDSLADIQDKCFMRSDISTIQPLVQKVKSLYEQACKELEVEMK